MKKEIEANMKGIVDDRFIELWWGLKLPGLGNRTPLEVFHESPEALLDYTRGYKNGD